MSKLFSKKAIILTLAVAMTAGLFAVSANAEAPGYAPGVDAQFWYTNIGLDEVFEQDFDFSWGIDVPQPLGNNTIQEYVHIVDTNDDFYVVTTHPQYFGVEDDYDDQVGAEYVMQITGLEVYDERGGLHDCFETGFGKIPAEYAVMFQTPTPEGFVGYFQCEITSKIIDLATGEVNLANWSDDDPRTIIYLAIPQEAGL